MKNIFTLLLGGLLTTSAFANNITINFSGNRDFEVMVDGRNVSSYGYSNTNSISLNNLRPGQHSLEVFRARRNKGWGNDNGPVYSSNFTVSPQYDLNINIDDWGRVQIYENRTNYGRNEDWRNDRGDRDHDRNWNNRDRDWNNNYSRAMNDRAFNQLVER